MDDQSKMIEARRAYFQAFGDPGPFTHGVSDNFVADVLWAAVRSGKPVPADFDWYPDLPKDAVV